MTREEAQYLRDHYQAESDHNIPVDEDSKLDYRLRIQSQYLADFIKRFNSGCSRENHENLSREFKEELIDPGFVDAECFPVIRYCFKGRHFTELRFEEHFQCYEILMADVFEVLLTAQQEQCLYQIVTDNPDQFVLVTPDEVKRLHVDIPTDEPDKNCLVENIADHSVKILTSNASSLSKVKSIPDEAITAKFCNCFKTD